MGHLLQGMGGANRYRGDYQRLTYEALSRLSPENRLKELGEIFAAARVRYAPTKARLMARNFDLITEMGGPEEATKLAGQMLPQGNEEVR